MNEYYSAAEPIVSADAAKSGGVKKKSSGQSGKEADKASTIKRRRAETGEIKSADELISEDGNGGCPPSADLDAQSSAGPSPIDDSGIQTSMREEDEVAGVQSATEEVRTNTTEAKPKCDVTDVDMDEGISTSSQADNRSNSVQVTSCMPNPNLTPNACSVPKSCSSSAATVITSTSSIPQCPPVSQHSPTTSAFQQTPMTLALVDGDAIDSTANRAAEVIAAGGPTCPPCARVPEDQAHLVTSPGQSESHLPVDKMDAKGSVPAVDVVTIAEPENAAPSSTSPQSPPTLPPGLNQVPSPPPPSTTPLADEKTKSAGDDGATTASSKTANKEASGNRSDASSAAPNASLAVANRRPANSNKPAGPAAAEQRHSKILRQAEIFNSLVMSHSRNEATTTGPKSTMTLERPKKVTIFSYKVSWPRYVPLHHHTTCTHINVIQTMMMMAGYGHTHLLETPPSSSLLLLSTIHPSAPVFFFFLFFLIPAYGELSADSPHPHGISFLLTTSQLSIFLSLSLSSFSIFLSVPF